MAERLHTLHLLDGCEHYPHVLGETIARRPQDVLIKEDLRQYLARRYAADFITPHEIEAVIKQLEAYVSARKRSMRHPLI